MPNADLSLEYLLGQREVPLFAMTAISLLTHCLNVSVHVSSFTEAWKTLYRIEL